jgi:hypothetical protein
VRPVLWVIRTSRAVLWVLQEGTVWWCWVLLVLGVSRRIL